MNIPAIVALVICTLVSSACTTLYPKEVSPEEVRRMLLTEDLLEPGDRVRLVTDDETVYEFRVTAIDLERGMIVGADQQVPIAEIVAVETREVSVGKTALLVGVVSYSTIAIMLFFAAPALILGAG